MGFCMKCGKPLADDERFCMGCGTAAGVASGAQPQAAPVMPQQPIVDRQALLNTLSQRLNTGAIIWIVIGVLQLVVGLLWTWWIAIVGVLNIVSSVKDMDYAKKIFTNQNGIVATFEPIVGPVITLVYNLLVGGIIGAAGSIYYFIGVRGYVMENQAAFRAMEQPQV